MKLQTDPRSGLDQQKSGTSMAPIENGEASIEEDSEGPIDDQGTEQFEAVEILKQVRDTAFESSDEKLALALGRPSKEISEWLNGEEAVDSDALIKIRALASERGVEVE